MVFEIGNFDHVLDGYLLLFFLKIHCAEEINICKWPNGPLSCVSVAIEFEP